MVNVYFYGKKYTVPADLTIMTAMEYAGYTLKRGCGCRHDFCGACATIYRIKGKNELKTCLACQTQVQEGMYVASIPFFPTDKRLYNIEDLQPNQQVMMELYPEIYSCIGCNACTKACPQKLNVMQWYDRIRQVKFLLVVMAIVIAVGSLIISNYLVRDLALGEHQNMEVWAEAMRTLNNADENTDVTLVLKVLNGNNTIPVIVQYKSGEIHSYRNLSLKASNAADSTREVKQMAEDMRQGGRVIRIYLNEGASQGADGDFMEICYDDSIMLKRLSSYPYIQLGVVLIFVVVAIFALLSSKKAEQNKVWVGLSKETAHQLGTPISSLMAWVEILKETYPHDELIPEMDKDVKRLEMIAERFSKIGSLPEPREELLATVLEHVIDYISRRTSNKVSIRCLLPEYPLKAYMCAPLFEWVIENLCKNAIDAMGGQGCITVTAFEDAGKVVVEVADTGKGISKNHFQTVFSPGFTTKKRGWGLGLSLAKRIVEEYHKGRIFVKRSEIGVGTTFRVELKKY